LLKSSLLNK